MLVIVILYLIISLYVTIWVGHKINRLGEVFLLEIFKENNSIVKPLNMLLLMGYYLINIGYVFILLRNNEISESLANNIALLSEKVGIVVFSLGFIHIINLVVFSIIYKFKSNLN